VGKNDFFNLGTYSTSFTVKLAREAARNARTLVNSGIDPQVEKQQRKQAQEYERLKQERDNNAATVNDVLDHYLKTLDNDRTKKNTTQQFISDVRPFIGDITAIQLSEEQAGSVIQRVVARGSNRSARNLYIALSAALNKARKNLELDLRGWKNPLKDVDKPNENAPNDRALSLDEVKLFWKALEHYHHMSPSLIDVLRLLLLTGQRVREITELRWSEVHFNEHYIDLPPERIKTGKKSRSGHVVPLPPMAAKIIARQPRLGLVVFPSRGDINVPINWQSLSKALTKLIKSLDNMEHFTPRDIRGTVKTHMARIRIMKEVRDRIQNHALNDVASKHYDRHDYFDEKYEGLQKWEIELKRIVGINTDT
jgi:integrase